MVEILSLSQLDASIKKELVSGKIFIYPTDTIYGLGCNAKKKESVITIREIKKRDAKPFSVIAPSKEWIYHHFVIFNKHYIQQLPGPYTFILTMKQRCVSSAVNNGLPTLGVRIPNHPFTSYLSIPFITTSVNYSGKSPIQEIKQIPSGIKKRVDYIIDDGPLYNKPSTLVDLTDAVPKIIKRER